MNCDDIARILDGDAAASGGTQQRALAAHLATCPDCMRDWAIHLRLASVTGPEPSAELAARCRALVGARLSEGKRRVSTGFLLAGALVVLGAAAAMLASRWADQPSRSITVVPAIVPVVGTAAVSGGSMQLPAPPVAPEPPAATSQDALKDVSAKPFTVRLLLENQATTADARVGIDLFLAALRDGLRAVPGLTFTEPVAGGDSAETPVDFRITVKAEGPGPGPENRFKFRVSADAEKFGPDGSSRGNLRSHSSGDILPGCSASASADLTCADPESVAANLLELLRVHFLPPDHSLRRQLQAQLIDPSVESRLRLKALASLQALRMDAGPGLPATRGGALRDAAVIRGVVALARAAPDPGHRAQVWRIVRGLRNTDLVEPLIASSRLDPDGDVRVEAVATLVSDFRDDPRTRTALEVVAREDARPLARAMAKRGLAGEDTWREYVATTLEDTSLSGVERIEALFHAMNLRMKGGEGTYSPDARIIRELDGQAIRGLTEALPQAARDSPVIRNSAISLLSVLAGKDDPAITEMLLESLRPGEQWLDKAIAINALVRRVGDSRVRAALQKISEEDSHPEVRRIASEALKSEVAAPPSPMPGT